MAEKKKPLPELNYNPGMTVDQVLASQDPVTQPSNGEIYDHALGMPDKPNFQPPAPTGEGPSKMDQIMAYLQPKFANAGKNLTTPLPGSYSEVGGDTKPSAADGMINGDVFPSGSPFGDHDDALPKNETGFGAAQGVDAAAAGAEMPDSGGDDKAAAVRDFVAKQRATAGAADPVDAKSYGYKADRNDDALKAALAERQEDQFHNNLGRAFNTASAAIGHQKLDNSFYDNMDKQSDTRVGDIETLRKGQAGEGDFAQKQKLEDPAAPENQAFRSALFSAMPTLKSMPGVENITLANPGPFEKIADSYQRAEATKAVNEQNRIMKQAQMDALGQERNRKEADMTASKLRGDAAYKAAVASEDSGDNALKTLEMARHNPVAYGAKAIETAREIVGTGRINAQEIQSLGGDRSVMGKLEQMAKQASEGTMTDANYGFYKELINAAKKSAQDHKAKVVDTYVNTYAHRNKKNYNDAYADLMGVPPPQQQQSAGTSNEDAQAIQWAKANPSDPRAAKILKLHGQN